MDPTLPVVIPDALTTCAHCLTLVGVTTAGLVGIDGSRTCPRNTHGCGETCGYFCGCNPRDWKFGPHEADALGAAA